MINGEPFAVFYTPVYSDEDNTEFWGMAFSGIPMAEVNSIITGLRVNAGITLALCIVIMSVIIYYLSTIYKKTLKEMVGNITELADGDLSPKKMKETVCYEFSEINNSIVEMQQRLSSTVGTITDTYESLEKTVNEVDKLSVSSERALFGLSSNCDLTGQHGKTKGQSKNDIND